jgi:hypothetical protein
MKDHPAINQASERMMFDGIIFFATKAFLVNNQRERYWK